jgi:uncharacterized protein (DUF983 family)
MKNRGNLMVKCVCGADNPNDAKYCQKCGKSLEPQNLLPVTRIIAIVGIIIIIIAALQTLNFVPLVGIIIFILIIYVIYTIIKNW